MEYVPYVPSADAVFDQSVELITEDIEGLLNLDTRTLWNTVKDNESFLVLIATYLRHATRPYDDSFQHLSSTDVHLWRKMLDLLYRIFVVQQQGAPDRPQRSKLLEKITNVPILLDLCSLYAALDDPRLCEITLAIIDLRPTISNDIAKAGVVIAENMSAVVEACLLAATPKAIASNQQALVNIIDGMLYLRDTCLTLCALLINLPSAATLLIHRSPTLIESLGLVHDQFIPAVQILTPLKTENELISQVEAVSERAAFLLLYNAFVQLPSKAKGKSPVQYSSDEAGGSSSTSNAMKGGVGSQQHTAAIASGEGLLNAMLLLGHREGASSTNNSSIGSGSMSLGPALAHRHGLGGSIQQALDTGNIVLDDAQSDYLAALLDVPSLAQAPVYINNNQSHADDDNNRSSNNDISISTDKGGNDGSTSTAGDLVELQSLVRQVRDFLPDYGEGFVAALLEHSNRSVQHVIDSLLEGNIPKSIQKLDAQMTFQEYKATFLEKKSTPPPKFSSSSGILHEKKEHFPVLTAGGVNSTTANKATDSLTAKYLDTRTEGYRQALLSAAADTQWEYEDEYDDSYDELLHVGADAGVAEIEEQFKDTSSNAGSSSSAVQRGMQGLSINGGGENTRRPVATPSSTAASKGNTAAAAAGNNNKQGGGGKKQQPKGKQQSGFYVLDGKVYNYNKPGSTFVATRDGVDSLIQEQRAAAFQIHGLGPGGNVPVPIHVPAPQGAVGGSNADSSGSGAAVRNDGNATGSRGGGRGGGGRGGGAREDTHNNKEGSSRQHDRRWKDKNKSGVGNHHRKDRAAQKMNRGMGGP